MMKPVESHHTGQEDVFLTGVSSEGLSVTMYGNVVWCSLLIRYDFPIQNEPLDA